METINFVAQIYPTPTSADQIDKNEWYVVTSDGEKLNIISLDIYKDNKNYLSLWENLL